MVSNLAFTKNLKRFGFRRQLQVWQEVRRRMSLFECLKDKLATNLKVSRLSLMTDRPEIVRYCEDLNASERTAVLNAIETQFKWESIAETAQATFSSSGLNLQAMRQVALAHAWSILKTIERENPGSFCRACAAKREPDARFCTRCGRRF
jgi:hypothetical protein